MASTTVNISVVQDKLYKVSASSGVEVFYSGKKVFGTGATGYFIANGVTQLVVSTTTPIDSSISVTEVLRNYYAAYDGQGGTWAYQPAIDKFTSQYSFRPEWYGIVGNRLASFKNGSLYIHNGQHNDFYGQTYDSILAMVHSDAGNTIKEYKDISIEGDTPDRIHFRTEVPYVQSSDLIGGSLDARTKLAGDFRVNEGVSYAQLFRDRLSPNVSGTFFDKMFKGDPVRGESCKSMIVYSAPASKRELKFVNLDFDESKGHSV